LFDETLAERFARRDAAAYETAYRSFGGRMHATALRLLGDRDAAQECVHDVFLYLWRRRTAYVAARGSLEAFLVSCTRNRALGEIRSGTRGREAVAKLDPETEYVMQQDPIERERIARAIAQLTEGQASVVQLAYYRSMTLSEVAAQLSIPLGTVKARLSAALRALRRQLVVGTNDGR
jgi:RNA polymerase sigma-70 factor, ECF subfamily